MKNFSITQAVIFGISGIAIVAAVLVFSLNRGTNLSSQVGTVQMWGTMSKDSFATLFEKDEFGGEDFTNIVYKEIQPEKFEKELVGALAEGSGPDLVLLRESQIVENESRLIKIPFANYDIRTYKETFVDEANMLVTDEGYIGMPFSIDPLVMYFNKDILNSSGIARPPETWTELLSLAPELSVSDEAFNISKSAIALGQYDNVKNAKEILWTLMMQAGSDVIVRSNTDSGKIMNGFEPIIAAVSGNSVSPASSAINFYTQFTNPSKTIYSWNGSLPSSEEFFLSGDLAFYLGFSSELPEIKIKNPNLNFDVAEFPQSKNATKKTTYGKMYFVGITKNTKDINSSYKTLIKLASAAGQTKFSNITGLPPIRRDLLSKAKPENSFQIVFNKSALISRGVFEPNDSVQSVVATLIKSVISGESKIEQAITKADAQIKKILTE